MTPNALEQVTQASYQSVLFNADNSQLTVSQVHRFLSHLLYQHPLCLPNTTHYDEVITYKSLNV